MSAGRTEPDERTRLATLRLDFPGWGFLVIRDRWVAMRGNDLLIWTSSADVLRRRLHEIQRWGPTG